MRDAKLIEGFNRRKRVTTLNVKHASKIDALFTRMGFKEPSLLYKSSAEANNCVLTATLRNLEKVMTHLYP